MPTTTELISELRGSRCRCGDRKRTEQTFCRSCYFKLPKALRRRLYNRIGSGYEEAYAEAVAALDSQEAGDA